jgi:hypothetical protein
MFPQRDRDGLRRAQLLGELLLADREISSVTTVITSARI